MESRFKMQISRMFRSSFGSCRLRNETDVIERPVFEVENRRVFNLIEPLSPKVRIFPSMCRPSRLQEPIKTLGNESKEVLRRRKVSDRGGVYVITGEAEGRTCPPASPISPLNSVIKDRSLDSKTRRKKPRKAKKTQKRSKKKEKYVLSSSSGETNNGWFSSENETEDETETFFSSKSFSSDSSESRNKRSSRRRRAARRNSEMSISPLVSEGKVEESFAVVKRSKDPKSDFRTSMVEMIVEKQMFSAKDLEKLLQCFLSLNSSHHHRVIVEVFTEIWEALFSWS